MTDNQRGKKLLRPLAALALLIVAGTLAAKVWQLDSRLKALEHSVDDLRSASGSPVGGPTIAERVSYNGTTFDTCQVDLTKLKVRLYFKDGKGQRLGSLQSLKEYVESESNSLLFATNAGMYTAEGAPLGLFIQNGHQVSPLNSRDGTDNFYLKPNGILAVTDKRAYILESSRFGAESKSVSHSDPILFATQSGPMLVIDGKIHPAFQPNSDNKVIRSGVGLISPTRVVFAISDRPVNFYDFAMLFKDRFKCDDALFLDGVVSRMYLPALKRYDDGGDFAALIGIVK